MNVKEVLEIVNEYIGRLNIGYEILLTEDQLTYFNIIKQDLDRLEKLEKALDKACEKLDYTCIPVEEELVEVLLVLLVVLLTLVVLLCIFVSFLVIVFLLELFEVELNINDLIT